mmetsp:Transcript_12988/g.14938  ORF Transcript_12988/g.14938 Transcript_12988/m.14938 type:complete len:586 (-) Transcript_12988:8-1765(-)
MSKNTHAVVKTAEPGLSAKARFLQSQLTNLISENTDVQGPILEFMDKSNDKLVNKICDGELKVSEEEKNCTDVINEWKYAEISSQIKTSVLKLKNQGEKISDKEVAERLQVVEKLIKNKDNASMDAALADDGLGKEVSQLINMTTVDYADPGIVGSRVRQVQQRKRSADDEEGMRKARELLDKIEQEKRVKKQKEAEKRKRMNERMKQEQMEYEIRQKEMEEEKESMQELGVWSLGGLLMVGLGERQKRLEAIRLKEEQRKKALKENEERYKENLKKIEEPLYKKIEKQYEKEYVMPELEKRKKELAEKRNFGLTPGGAKVFNKEELLEHEKHYEEMRKQAELKRQVKYKDDNDYDPSVYKSRFLDTVLEDEKNHQLEQQKKYEELSELMKKKKNYAKLVLETHKPKVSKRKKMEMELIKQNLQNPTAFEKIKKRLVSSSQNRLNSYKALNSSNLDGHEEGVKMVSDTDSINKKYSAKKHKEFDWRQKNRLIDIPKPPMENKSIDYLAQQRNKTNQNETSTSHSHQRFLQGSDLKEKARLLEQEAIKKEQLMKANKDDQVSARNEVNDLIIDSIKAKIELLDQIE